MVKVIETVDRRYECYENIPSNIGGYDEINKLLTLIRAFGYSLFFESYKQKNMPLRVYAYIDDEPNAFAIKLENAYYIGVSTGTFIELKRWFNTWLACPKIYEALKIRQTENLSMTLCYYSLLFLIAHECTHVLYGHCDYLKNAGGFFFERSTQITREDMLHDQALEICADCSAILMCAIQILSDERNKDVIEEKVRRILFALYSIFKLFGEDEEYNFEEFIENDLYRYDHPHAGIRFEVVIRMLEYSTKFLTNLNYEAIINEYMNFEREVLGIKDVKKMITSISYTAKGAEYIKELLLKWNDIRYLYLPYAKIELLQWKEIGQPPVFINNDGNVIQPSNEMLEKKQVTGDTEHKLVKLYGNH